MCAKVYALRISQQMAFKQSFFLVLVLLASSVVLGKVEGGEAAETTKAVKATASRKILPMGGQIIKMLGVGVNDGLEQNCAHTWEDCSGIDCCPGCDCALFGELAALCAPKDYADSC